MTAEVVTLNEGGDSSGNSTSCSCDRGKRPPKVKNNKVTDGKIILEYTIRGAARMDKTSQPLLKISHLKTYFDTDNTVVKAVDDISFHVNQGELVGIVGESGSGKSVTSLSIMRLIEQPGQIVGGEINFAGQDLLKISEREMEKIRGNEIAMVFQEPLTSLNPVLTVGRQISETIRVHRQVSKQEARQQTIELLKRVQLPRPEKIYRSYPHTLSGGMRQRVMIAMALSCEPKLLIADEPTTALDVSIQAQILQLLKQLSKDIGVAVLLITHDLGVIAEMVDRVIVLYGGKIVEIAQVHTLFDDPKHPYTKGLLKSMLPFESTEDELYSIKGHVPQVDQMPSGCKFHPRCKYAIDICQKKEPPLKLVKNSGKVRCWLYDKASNSRSCKV